MSKVEVHQFFGENWRREIIQNGTKMSRFRQMDALPFQFPLES